MTHLLLAWIFASSSIAAPNAKFNLNPPKGGEIIINLQAEPTTLHPILSSDGYARTVQAYIMDRLADRNVQTLAWEPRLAEKWEVSKDNKVFTFTLRKNLTFSDGKPLTSADVKFSFDMVFEPKYNAANLRPYFENIEKVEAIDPLTVRFTAKNNYFLNFNVAATMDILPMHIYSDVAKSNRMNKTIIGAGPYVLDRYNQGQRIILKKNPNWYGNTAEHLKPSHNFEKITFRFVKEQGVYMEMLKKGQFDYHALLAQEYQQMANGGEWGKTVFKVKTENSSPKNYRYLGWNLKREIFKDKNVRIALGHLINIDEAIKKFRFGLEARAVGPADPASDVVDPSVKAIEFNPSKAVAMLKKAGWSDTDKDGTLDKVLNGKKTDLKFTIMHSNQEFEKFLTFFQQDFRKAGVGVELQYLEWNSYVKALEAKNFDVISMAWSSVIDWDPKQIWHSTSAAEGGSNHVSYNNPEVDKLIDEARVIVDRNERIKKLKRVYKLVAEDAPYVFLNAFKYDMYAYKNTVSRTGDTFKYDVGTSYWWMAK